MKFLLLLLLFFLIIPQNQIGSDNTKGLLLSNTEKLYFSSVKSMDTFTIKIVGESILQGQMIFQIHDSKGMEIFKEVYPAKYLIGYGLKTKDPTLDEKETYIKERIRKFFNDENFYKPAISDNDKFDPDYSDKNTWQDIKSDSTAIGFYYLIGEEQGCRIAYSKQWKEVVKYFCCC